jgi:hypothetical protein
MTLGAQQRDWMQRDRFFDAVDVAVVPSTAPESFGQAAAEAMAAGVAVVVSDAGALTEVVGPAHPWVSRAGDAEDLARALVAALDADAAPVVAAARDRWQHLYSPAAGRAAADIVVADPGIARQLSEIGVTLLMFGVGLHFSIRDLWAVRRFAVPGSIAKIAVAVLMGMLLARAWGWTWGAGLIFGLCLAVASTVVFLRAMNERGQLETVDGRLGVGWLIVEDLVVILALVAVPALAAPLGGTPSAADPGANVYAT